MTFAVDWELKTNYLSIYHTGVMQCFNALVSINIHQLLLLHQMFTLNQTKYQKQAFDGDDNNVMTIVMMMTMMMAITMMIMMTMMMIKKIQ